MREIKFRAWDASKKELVCIADGYFISFCTGALDYWWVGDVNYCDGDLLFDSMDKGSKVMQYTGLKDKLGKEIYEGDILKTCQIKGWWTGKVLHTKSGRWIYDYRTQDGHNNKQTLINFNHDTLEIIGNVYENPELTGGDQP